jgi:hypothetical protein
VSYDFSPRRNRGCFSTSFAQENTAAYWTIVQGLEVIGFVDTVPLRHASSICCKPSRLRNHRGDKHSRRSVPLKASINVLSTGFPGRLKSGVTRYAEAH